VLELYWHVANSEVVSDYYILNVEIFILFCKYYVNSKYFIVFTLIGTKIVIFKNFCGTKYGFYTNNIHEYCEGE
jgi:hypothetical protein